MNIFSMNSFLGRFLYWIADVIILNFLWFICSLPIFTIGASTTALYYSMMIRTRRDEGYIHKNFFKSFKENFKQSTIIWIIMIIVGLVIVVDYRIGMYLKEYVNPTLGNVVIITSTILFFLFAITSVYIFPIQAKFYNSIKDNLKNSFLMSIGHFGYTLLILVITAMFIFLTLTSHAFIGVQILCGFGLYAFLTGNIYITIFRKHIPNELEDDLEAVGRSKF